MRTITLELLRHGPPHNQLLSPLTQYLALCENHAAVTVHVPFEHNQFLHRLRALGYQIHEESRQFQIKDTAKELCDLLAKIPGLIAELNRESKDVELTHLRLVISASELALLPFELAAAPNGSPGAGQFLQLQSQLPVCITREVRRVAETHLSWSPNPKILLVAAAPADVGPIPIESHLLALRRAISPWVGYFETEDKDGRRQQVVQHLVVLPHASVEAIEQACAADNYTHIHILAHGVETRDGYDVRFGLALHDARDPHRRDVVSGARLATALRAAHRPGAEGLSCPIVVTLASCNSASVGSVAGAGSSIAHALHEAGIPVVIAGQFPLSFPGSVRMVEVLYDGLLWGSDPRLVLNDLRRRLHTQFPKTHDWASITAYASFPPNFDNELTMAQVRQASRNIDVSFDFADRVTRPFLSRSRNSTGASADDAQVKLLLQRARRKIDVAKARLEKLLDTVPEHQRALVCGRLASTEKRQAEVLYWQSKAQNISVDERRSVQQSSIAALRRARTYYWKAFLVERADSWGVVQYLSLELILKNLRPDDSQQNTPADDGQVTSDTDFDDPWTLAHVLSLADLHHEERAKVKWAHGNLIELYLLAMVMNSGGGRPTAEKASEQAKLRARELVAMAEGDSFEVYATRRQILRYIDWYSKIANLGNLQQLAANIADILPETVLIT